MSPIPFRGNMGSQLRGADTPPPMPKYQLSKNLLLSIAVCAFAATLDAAMAITKRNFFIIIMI
jgi:hypothetical protein